MASNIRFLKAKRGILGAPCMDSLNNNAFVAPNPPYPTPGALTRTAQAPPWPNCSENCRRHTDRSKRNLKLVPEDIPHNPVLSPQIRGVISRMWNRDHFSPSLFEVSWGALDSHPRQSSPSLSSTFQGAQNCDLKISFPIFPNPRLGTPRLVAGGLK